MLNIILWVIKLFGWAEPEPVIIDRPVIVEVDKIIEKPVIVKVKLDIPDDIKIILPDIETLIRTTELAVSEGTSGEWKRHNVYAMLIKKYPDIRKSRLALAIEIAIQRMNGEPWL